MKWTAFDVLTGVSRRGRDVLRRVFSGARGRIEPPVAGGFQPYNYTCPNRYPWLFEFASANLGNAQGQRILSFGCSQGDEVFALRGYFPQAAIKGIDIQPRNIDVCNARARAQKFAGVAFAAASTTQAEASDSYDAIFCLAVLCHGDLSVDGAKHCEPLLNFENFDRTVADFSRCLKPGGLLLLHTTNFRFCDTSAAGDFETILEADPSQLAADVLYDRDNRLMEGERYRAVAFRKRWPASRETIHAAAPS